MNLRILGLASIQILISASLIFGSKAWSQDRDPAAVPMNFKPLSKKPRPFTLGIQETFYLADESTLLGEKHFEEIGFRVRGQRNSDFDSAGIDIGATYGINIPDYYSFYAPEAYYRFMLFDNTPIGSPMLTFGRKKDRWSLLDSFWELGTWQPQYRWDYLRPEEQGLMGVFAETSVKAVRVVLFATPLFIPESGPSYKLRNHKLVSDNPWFFEPTEQLKVIKSVADVHYDPKIPPINEIVVNGAAGGMAEVGARSAGLWGRLSHIYKPRNQLSLPFEGVLRTLPTESYVEVTIYPRVIYHQLTAFDIGYKTEDFSLWLANLIDTPIDETYPSNQNYQKFYPSHFISPGFEISQHDKSGVAYGAVLSYVKKTGDDPKEFGPDVSASNPIFGSPYNFVDAARIALRLSIPIANGFRSTSAIWWTQSFEDESSWIKLTTESMINERFKFSLEADFLGSLSPQSNNQFLSRYRGNDRVIGSLSMVF